MTETEKQTPQETAVENAKEDHDHDHEHHEDAFVAPMQHIHELQEAEHVHLGWHTWLVIFVTCFISLTQIFVVVAAGSVIAFIVRDLGDSSMSGWIIQAPLLMQSVLGPIVGRLSDVIDRKYLAALPPLLAFAGAVISAKATSMSMLIVGGLLIGVTLSTIAIVQAIPSEILPLKYRALANGFAYAAGTVGSIIGLLGSGGLTNASPSGWRNIFWIQAAFHLASSIGLFLFYHPTCRSDFPKMSVGQIVWACDPIGSGLFVTAATLILLAMDWGGGAYGWGDAHVIAPLCVGLATMVLFGFYEWKGRSDGLIAHVFFKGSPNFPLALFAFAIEGWLFYSAVNSITPQLTLNLGFLSDAWAISVRQFFTTLTALVGSVVVTVYATKFKDLKYPLVVSYILFLAVTIFYCTITPNMNHAQLGINFVTGMSLAGPLTLLVALIQFSSPHAYLSTATGLSFSARAIGGAFGSATLDAIINSKLSSYPKNIGDAAIKAGLPSSSVPALLEAFASGAGFDQVRGLTPSILEAATNASHWSYARAYRMGWASLVPFVVIALVAVSSLKGIKELMTEKVEATVEHTVEVEVSQA